METSASLLERLAGKPTDDDWRRLLELYQPLLRAWTARVGVTPSDSDDLAQEVLLVVFRENGDAPALFAPGCAPSSSTGSATISAAKSIARRPPATAPSCKRSRNWSRPTAR